MSSPRARAEPDSRETEEDAGEPERRPPGIALSLLLGQLHSGRLLVALGDRPVRLGREVDGEPDIGVVDARVSRRHAEIHWSDVHRQHWIRDLASRNGLYLNGARVSRELLRAGDLIRIGDTVLRVVESDGGSPELASSTDLDPAIVGRSSSLRRSLLHAARIAPTDAPVLVLGPSGTGKELVARAIHRVSGRPGPLVPVNCAALPGHLVESELFGHEKGAFSGAEAARPGLFRTARTGTIFLDEVGELAPEIQAKLLRVLDSGSVRPVGGSTEIPVDVRVIAATNRELGSDVVAGGFRADLYARLAETVVRLDALRDRPEDLEPLWRHFVAELGGGVELGLGGAAFEAMALHPWPYNVRELRQLVRLVLLSRPRGGTLTAADLPEEMRVARTTLEASRDGLAGLPLPPAAGDAPSARDLRRLVEEFHGNVKEVAAFLGRDRKQVYRWLRREQIDPEAYRP